MRSESKAQKKARSKTETQIHLRNLGIKMSGSDRQDCDSSPWSGELHTNHASIAEPARIGLAEGTQSIAQELPSAGGRVAHVPGEASATTGDAFPRRHAFGGAWGGANVGGPGLLFLDLGCGSLRAFRRSRAD